jgi:hypothetical protein
VFAMGVVTGVGRGAERTSFHRLDSPFLARRPEGADDAKK